METRLKLQVLLDLQQIKYARYDKHNDDGKHKNDIKHNDEDKHNDDGCPKLNLRTLASVVSVVADTRTDTGSNPSDYSHSSQ